MGYLRVVFFQKPCPELLLRDFVVVLFVLAQSDADLICHCRVLNPTLRHIQMWCGVLLSCAVDVTIKK